MIYATRYAHSEYIILKSFIANDALCVGLLTISCLDL